VTWIDWSILAYLLYSALAGLRRGIAVVLIAAAGALVGYLVASMSYAGLADVLLLLKVPRPWAGTLGYAVLLLVIYGAVGTTAALLLDTRLAMSNRVLGAIGGVLKGALMASLVLGILLASPWSERVQRDTQRSLLAPAAVRVQRDGARSLARVLPNNIRPFGADDRRF
jgi:membrane protein required for colicin V production